MSSVESAVDQVAKPTFRSATLTQSEGLMDTVWSKRALDIIAKFTALMRARAKNGFVGATTQGETGGKITGSKTISYMPYLTTWGKISQNLAHLEADSHKIFFQISQNFQTILHFMKK